MAHNECMTDRAKPQKKIHTAEEFDLDILHSEDDLFRWFLLCYLLGKPIQSQVAVQTWRLFINAKMDHPWVILEASEAKLSKLLVEGRYTHYNYIMAKALHVVTKQLIDMYDGSLLLVIERSENEAEFAKRLKEFHGVGPKTAEIIMRETEEFFARRVE